MTKMSEENYVNKLQEMCRLLESALPPEHWLSYEIFKGSMHYVAPLMGAMDRCAGDCNTARLMYGMCIEYLKRRWWETMSEGDAYEFYENTLRHLNPDYKTAHHL